MEVDTFVEDYGGAVEAHRATVLVGAGLSMGAGYPSWNSLLEPHRVELGVPANVIDLTMMAQYVENEVGGREHLVRAICTTIGSVRPIPTESHELLRQLPLDEIWTTNYDPLIEMTGGGSDVIELEDDFLDVGASARRVYKMHGSIRFGDTIPVGGIDNLVISRSDFDMYESQHPRFWRLLQAQILTKSFLFLGFSFNDPNFEAALRLVRTSTRGRLMNHFALVSREQGDEIMFNLRSGELLRSGVQVVAIESHDEVSNVLRKLVARTRPTRLFVSGSQPGGRVLADGPSATTRYPVAESIEPKLEEFAKVLGKRLAVDGVSVTTSSSLGAMVGYALLEELAERYDHNRVMLVRRRKGEPVDPPNMRTGAITFIGEDPEELRDEVFAGIRSIVVLGGGEGTRREVNRANERGMGVVPVAFTGGTAFDVWEEMSADLTIRDLGGRPINKATFAALNSGDEVEALNATEELILQAMYLPNLVDRGHN